MRAERPERLGRRSFLRICAGVCVASVSTTVPLFAQDKGTNVQTVNSKYEWLNSPASFRMDREKLIVRTKPKTDFWRKTYYGYVNDNGHFYSTHVQGNFEFEALISGKYAAQYDQAGLMVRLNPDNWMKCGTELVDGMRHASVVITREYSDWSTLPDLAKDGPVWWKAVRTKDAIECFCSLDGKNYQSVRQGYLVPSESLQVGVMCASPEGNGFEAVFQNLQLTSKNSAQ